MKRVLLCVALTVGVFAATGGVAAAEVDNLDFGDHTNATFDGKFEVVNDNNQVADEGRRIVFSVTFDCTAGERIGIIFTVDQNNGTNGGGATRQDCTGAPQEALVVAQANPGEGTFTDEDNVGVEGTGFTDANAQTGLNDIDFADDELEPFSPEIP